MTNFEKNDNLYVGVSAGRFRRRLIQRVAFSRQRIDLCLHLDKSGKGAERTLQTQAKWHHFGAILFVLCRQFRFRSINRVAFFRQRIELRLRLQRKKTTTNTQIITDSRVAA